MSAAWHECVPEARQAVSCAGDRHDVVWRRGRLVLAGHGSLEAERALYVLGGRPPECLEFLQHWWDGLRSPDFLEEWAKLDRPQLRRMQWYRQVMVDWTWVQDRMLGPLAHFNDDLLDRLAYASILRLLRDPGGVPDLFNDVIVSATAARARRAFVAGLQAAGVPGAAAALVRMRCEMGGGRAGLDGTVSGSARSWSVMRLRSSWLLDVFARGLAVVDGQTVLDAWIESRRPAVQAVTWIQRDGTLRPRLHIAPVVREASGRWRLERAMAAAAAG